MVWETYLTHNTLVLLSLCFIMLIVSTIISPNDSSSKTKKNVFYSSKKHWKVILIANPASFKISYRSSTKKSKESKKKRNS